MQGASFHGVNWLDGLYNWLATGDALVRTADDVLHFTLYLLRGCLSIGRHGILYEH